MGLSEAVGRPMLSIILAACGPLTLTPDSSAMIDAGIMDGDCVVVRQQPHAEQGEVVVAGIPDGEATVKYFSRVGGRVVLTPANARLSPMEFAPDEITVYGKVVTVLRRL